MKESIRMGKISTPGNSTLKITREEFNGLKFRDKVDLILSGFPPKFPFFPALWQYVFDHVQGYCVRFYVDEKGKIQIIQVLTIEDGENKCEETGAALRAIQRANNYN